MKFTQTRFRYLAAASAVACTGIAAGAAGAHAATVEVALIQAREAAQVVQDKRDGLASSLARAQTVAATAESHLTEDEVSAAVVELDTTVNAAASTAEGLDVVVELPDAVSAPLRASAVAEGAEGGIVTSPQDSESEAIPDDVIGSSEAPVVENVDVQKVLDREKVGLDAVRAATDELERTAEALDEAAAEVDRVTDEVSDVTAKAALDQALVDLDAENAQAGVALAESFETLATVGDQVMDPAAIESATDARDNLRAALLSSAVDDDLDSVTAVLAGIQEAARSLDQAMGGVGTSHLAWVDAENARIDAKNAELTQQYKAAKADAVKARTKKYRAAVAAHQNGWSGAPPGVSYSNGRLPASELCTVPFATNHQLQCDAVDALVAANAAYRADTGRNLSFTDSYRSYGAQVAARAAKPTTTAVPGTSNHGWGMAVDFDYASARWMAANGADFGWVHPRWARAGGSKPEWWHLEFVAPGVADQDAPEKPDLVSNVTSVLPSFD